MPDFVLDFKSKNILHGCRITQLCHGEYNCIISLIMTEYEYSNLQSLMRKGDRVVKDIKLQKSPFTLTLT